MRVKRVSTAEEAKAVASEWKADIERIDHSLFYGTSAIYLARSVFGGVYVVCNLVVNGIKECNVNTLIEQASGKPIAEIEALRNARIEAERKRRAELNAEYEASKARKAAEAKVHNDKFVTKLKESYKEVISNEQPVGTIVGIPCRGWDGKYKLEHYLIEKRTARACDDDGRLDYCRGNNQKLVKKPCKCYVKVSA